jgi:glutathionylspermidine synthase
VDVREEVSVDNRLIPAQAPDLAWLRRNGLAWLGSDDNADYLANRVVAISQSEMSAYHDAVRTLYQKQLDTAQYVAQQGLWQQVGVPPEAVALVEYSLRHEQHLHLVGRYDFAGGLDGLPLRLLEFNADTCSLLPETVQIMPQTADLLQRKPLPISYQTFEHLVEAWRRILRQHADREPTLLLSGMGYEEDTLNLEVIQQAARQAGFRVAQQVDLERVIFDTNEGVLVELGPDNYQRYDFWFKMVPWEFICYEEPELLSLLDEIIRNQQCIVLNPAFTMLLQSKGMLPLLAERYPEHPAVLQAFFDEKKAQQQGAYVAKPTFGRMGDNVRLYDERGTLEYENEGDYGDFPYVYQQRAALNEDGRGYLYQPSTYWIQKPSGICFRRQEDVLIDDDAQFVGHVVE